MLGPSIATLTSRRAWRAVCRSPITVSKISFDSSSRVIPSEARDLDRGGNSNYLAPVSSDRNEPRSLAPLGMTITRTRPANHGYAAARSPLRRTVIQTQSRILRRHRADVGARHRRDDRDLQRRERRALAAAALPEFGPHRPD